LYARHSSDGSFAPLFTVTPPNRTVGQFGAGIYSGQSIKTPVFAGASTDFERLLFEANDALTPEAEDGGSEEDNLYESVDGQLRLVNVLPNGTTEANATFGGPPRGDEQEWQAPFIHVISEDGDRIFWTDLNTGNLYLREGGTRTVQIDASVGGGGLFWTASPDGSKVIFTKGGDLYEYHVDTEQTSDLTPSAEVVGVVGTSEDDSYLYFVAKGALAAGASPQECMIKEVDSRCNLYVWHEGEPVRFITTLSGEDNENMPVGEYGTYYGDWRASLGSRTAETTPDGRHLVFMSHTELTSYKFSVAESGSGLAEIYVYDFAGGGHLSCASCNPTGEAPTHKALSALLIPSYSNTVGHRWISEDGTRVFFMSMDPLVPQDGNGMADVYEWEQDGAGECHTSDGCIYLLSGGSSPEHSYFADASANGDDVFIVTRAQLVPQDENENMDLYDVHVGAPKPPAAPVCSDALCQQSGAATPPPVFGVPASSTFSGFGNAASIVQGKSAAKPKGKLKPCKKRFVKRKGRCVKRKAKSKKARRSARGGK
jgi:hypothetical protein